MSPRSWNRREQDVTPAGYFTVLKSKGWFSAVRLPGGFRYLVKGPPTPEWLQKPAGAASAEEQKRGGGQETESSLQILPADTGHRGLLRMAVLALVAAAITYGLLWWIGKGGR